MLSSVYAEDIFQGFYDRVTLAIIQVHHNDYSPILSFGQKIYDAEQLTQNQANYIIKILEKYKNISAGVGYDYINQLPNLQWRQTFRVLDLTKRIYVENSENLAPTICLKFPYQLKKQFDEEIDNWGDSSSWDHIEKVRKINLYDCNLIQLYEFAQKHSFDIDESFMCALADVEEIWQNYENVVPKSNLDQLTVGLSNSSEDAERYFETKRTNDILNDALLAKSMGYPLDWQVDFTLGKIVSSLENTFWIKDNDVFFSMYKNLTGKICVILDRSSNPLTWLQKFVADADKNEISRDDIKVCFRESKEGSTGLNEWVKLAGVGGKVESGRILIFETKPAKWLFKEIEDVKMLVTNNIYPPTNTLTRDWFQSHPCVIYLGNIKPSEQKGHKIVEL